MPSFSLSFVVVLKGEYSTSLLEDEKVKKKAYWKLEWDTGEYEMEVYP
ncbi:MAG: hypothetical protein QXX84_09310 [Sulfolobales archaeon]